MLQGSQALRLLGSKALTGACKHPKHKHSEIHYMDYKTTPGPKSSKKPPLAPWIIYNTTLRMFYNLLPMRMFTTCFQCCIAFEPLASNAYVYNYGCVP